LVGMFHKKVEIDLHGIGGTGREKIITGSTMYTREDFVEAIRLMRDREFDPDLLITHRMPISKIQEAHEMLLNKDVEAVKVVLRHENAE